MASRLTLFSVLIALFSVYCYISFPAILDHIGGRVTIDKTRLVRWENETALNNGNCKVNSIANACEDVRIHFKSSTAFLACGDPEERTRWYPPACIRTVEERSTFREHLFKYDIKKDKATQLRIVGLDGDFVTHGLDIWPVSDDKIHIFAVNHARAGDSIAIFEHKIGSDTANLVKEVHHPHIRTANGVAPTGPFTFYFTNDHYFEKGIWRDLEEQWGPWTWASHVQYCDASGEQVNCSQVSDSVPGANGLVVDGNHLYLGDSKNGTVAVYDIISERKLKRTHLIDLGAAADNIRVLPGSGDLIVSVFPTLEDLPLYLANIKHLGKTFHVPAGILRLRRDRDYTPEMIYYDDGSVLSFMTAADLDPFSRVIIGAAVLQYGGFAVCKIPADYDLS
ncbi:paraoxonase 2 [Xylariales sp. PMI_506]|nr:paraoxonase 2 [Xylariales sp. PMI_506]